MTHLKVVEFPQQVSLADIPGMLRKHAVGIEDREEKPRTVLVVELGPDGDISTFCFGDNPSRCETIGMLMIAQKLQAEDRDP